MIRRFLLGIKIKGLFKLARKRIELTEQAFLAWPFAVQIRMVGLVGLQYTTRVVSQARGLAKKGEDAGYETEKLIDI